MKRAPAPRDASKVDKPQRSPCDAVTNATEIAPPGEPAALRHLRTGKTWTCSPCSQSTKEL